MHPIEGFIYNTGALVPLLFSHHPLMLNFVKIELTYSAVLGHDGHDYPAHGDWFHLVHHMKINCNYGSPAAPFDYIFGTIDYNGEDEVADSNERYYKERV